MEYINNIFTGLLFAIILFLFYMMMVNNGKAIIKSTVRNNKMPNSRIIFHFLAELILSIWFLNWFGNALIESWK